MTNQITYFFICIFLSTNAFSQGVQTFDFLDYFDYEIDCDANIISIVRNSVEFPVIVEVSSELCPGVECYWNENPECCIDIYNDCVLSCLPLEQENEVDHESLLSGGKKTDSNSEACLAQCESDYLLCKNIRDQNNIPSPRISFNYVERSLKPTPPHPFDDRFGSNAFEQMPIGDLSPGTVVFQSEILQSSATAETACDGYLNYPEDAYLTPCFLIRVNLFIFVPLVNERCEVGGSTFYQFLYEKKTCISN